eukprot:TRINITY_DN1789_c0_g1_i3.p1 TRINITY_DN1789_c0_g1~~TRINITY_DN1789_c0_g1_i3.p1  ORF type:complete len:504 (+),score=92.70 TRINITY_DN1789_c0_g1_i3:79-1512(+)
MNLPAAIERSVETDNIPPTLQAIVQQVREQQGCSGVEQLMKTRDEVAQEDLKLLRQANALLDEEEKTDSELRKRFGVQWQRPPSHALTGDLRKEISNYLSHVDHARKSDGFVGQTFSEIKPFIDLLAGPETELRSRLPQNNKLNSDGQNAIEKLKEQLKGLDSCIAERSMLEIELKTRVDQDDISAKLINAQIPQEVVYKQELRKYEDLQRKLQKNFEMQGQLLEQTSETNQDFVAARNSNVQAKKRAEALQALEGAYTSFLKLKANISEGIHFYTNFHAVLQKFCTKCNDYVFARNQQKSQILAVLASGGGGGGSEQARRPPTSSYQNLSKIESSPSARQYNSTMTSLSGGVSNLSLSPSQNPRGFSAPSDSIPRQTFTTNPVGQSSYTTNTSNVSSGQNQYASSQYQAQDQFRGAVGQTQGQYSQPAAAGGSVLQTQGQRPSQSPATGSVWQPTIAPVYNAQPSSSSPSWPPRNG